MRKSINTRRWNFQAADAQAEHRLVDALEIHPIVARLLVQRGLNTPEKADLFLNPSLDRMHDPFLLPDIDAACERLKRALANHEKILIHGDYDGDGITSAALWHRALTSLGADVDVFVPHRKRDGYDMRRPFIDAAKEAGVTLIVTTDCGIQRIDEVEHARDSGIDVIITDHHTPNSNGKLPKAIAVINPHRKDSIYPFSELAGVGVSFKVCEALSRYLGYSADAFRRAYLDLAAIGTVTDVMPLLDENRIMVKHGLVQLQQTKKPGLRALIDICGLANKPIDTFGIGFGLGPRLNAASRIDETQIALDLLLAKDPAESERLAQSLNALNTERKDTQARIFEEAMASLIGLDMSESRCLVITGKGWSGSVVGIVASKMVDRFHRPCVVIAMDDESRVGRGSARSITSFNMFKAVDQCGAHLIEYGGHAHAAGFAIEGIHVAGFKEQMNGIAMEQLSEEDMVPTLDVDMEIAPEEITLELLAQLQQLAPFGNENAQPVFVSRNVPVISTRQMGADNRHLKLSLKVSGPNVKDVVEAPWWYKGEHMHDFEPGISLDLAYCPSVNEWNGNRSVQFMLEDVRPPEW